MPAPCTPPPASRLPVAGPWGAPSSKGGLPLAVTPDLRDDLIPLNDMITERMPGQGVLDEEAGHVLIQFTQVVEV